MEWHHPQRRRSKFNRAKGNTQHEEDRAVKEYLKDGVQEVKGKEIRP